MVVSKKIGLSGISNSAVAGQGRDLGGYKIDPLAVLHQIDQP